MTDVPFEIPALQQVVARAIVRSFFAMQGGDPDDLSDDDISPNSGDLQLAFDVLNVPEIAAAIRLREYLSECRLEKADVLHYTSDRTYDFRVGAAYILFAMLKSKAGLA